MGLDHNNELVVFPGANYEDLKFRLNPSLGVTDIEFLSSDKLGFDYENNAFAGGIVNGNMYFLKVNDSKDRPNVLGSQHTKKLGCKWRPGIRRYNFGNRF